MGPLLQYVSKPARHSGHAPHEGFAMITWSPGCSAVTALPTRSTTPAPSWPNTAGHGIGKNPSRACIGFLPQLIDVMLSTRVALCAASIQVTLATRPAVCTYFSAYNTAML